MVLFELDSLEAKEIEVIERINEMQSKLSYAVLEPRRWAGLLRRSSFARAIQGSNTIEGFYVTLEDAIAAADYQEPVEAPAQTWQAVTGYRNAMTYILQLAGDPYFAYSVDLIRGLHYMMQGYELTKRPGTWRPGHVYVRREPSGEIVYEGPDADSVPALMAELALSLNRSGDIPGMVGAAMAHLNLVMIHPFADGNGRMARALQTLVLAREGILDPRFSSIEEYLGRNTQDYYRVLGEVGQGRWNPHQDPRPWVRFCLTAHYRQAYTLLRRTREMRRTWDMLERLVHQHQLPERVIFALFDAAHGLRVRNASYRSAAEVSQNLASRDLKALSDHGLLIFDRRPPRAILCRLGGNQGHSG